MTVGHLRSRIGRRAALCLRPASPISNAGPRAAGGVARNAPPGSLAGRAPLPPPACFAPPPARLLSPALSPLLPSPMPAEDSQDRAQGEGGDDRDPQGRRPPAPVRTQQAAEHSRPGGARPPTQLAVLQTALDDVALNACNTCSFQQVHCTTVCRLGCPAVRPCASMPLATPSAAAPPPPRPPPLWNQ